MNWRGILLIGLATISFVPPATQRVENLLQKIARSDDAIAANSTPVEQGQIIAGYPVTSGFGPRQSPCDGCSSNHGGVDLATPEGTPLHAPGDARINCFLDANGGGLVADIWIGDQNHMALHLKECNEGAYKKGEVFAKTGNTGNGTGPHLDWRHKSNGIWIKPQKQTLEAALIGNPAPTIDVVDLIREFESFHPSPYWDYSQYSWGYGTKAPGPSGEITEQQAKKDLLAFLDRNCYPLIDPLALSQNQAVAVTSLCYNIGPVQLESSTLYKYLMQGNHNAAADEFLKWDKANGERLPGLTSRRQKEREIFLGIESQSD